MQLASDLIACLPQPIVEAVVRARRKNAVFRRWSDSLAEQFSGRGVTVRDGAATGLVFNSGRSNVSYTIAQFAPEPDIEQAIVSVLRSGMTLYDIGASFGWLSLIAARLLGPRGRVVTFEPIDTNVKVVENNARLNKFANITTLPIAHGNVDGTAQFLRSAQPSHGMLEGIGKTPDEFLENITVTVKRLDTPVRECALPPPHVIKMDIEGGEVEALPGAAFTISTFRPLMFIELHDTNAAVASMLRRYDYEVCLPGTSACIGDATGNLHVFAVPRERAGCADLLSIFRDPAFLKCERSKGGG